MARKIVYPDADEKSAQIITGSRLARLESLGQFEMYCDEQPDDAAFIERLADADAAISGWGLSNAVLAKLPKLEVISFTGLGASTFIDIAEAARRNITVTHTLSAAATVAEHTMALMLDAARHVSRLDRDLRNGLWNTDTYAMDLRGQHPLRGKLVEPDAAGYPTHVLEVLALVIRGRGRALGGH